MKNVSWQTNPTEREQYIRSLFSTNRYFESHEINDTVLAAAKLPLIWFDYSDPVVERLNFSTWWGCIARRNDTYSNPHIRDLYLIHELTHAVNHTSRVSDFETWKDSRIQEEESASFFSDMKVYNLLPWLRSKTLDFPILADEADGFNIDEMMAISQSCRLSPDRSSPARIRAWMYTQSNSFWCDLWAKEFPAVEEAWHHLLETGDIEAHILWLSANSKNQIPFYDNALRFNELIVNQSE
jgi:hypothetical protein